MRIFGNSVLITGAGSGIGLALAKTLARRNSRIAICGRDENKLEKARLEVPGLQTKRCNLTARKDLDELLRWALEVLPELNIVINNAGVARKTDLSQHHVDFEAAEEQLTTDLYAPIHLTLGFLPHLRRQPQAAIVNITTGLVYSPDASTPTYSAAKVGLHTWTQALRYQLQGTSVRVFEVLPPIVDTEMISGLGIDATAVSAETPQQVAEAVLKGIADDKEEIRISPTKSLYAISRVAPKTVYRSLNQRIQKMQTRQAV
jgi:uncharacterized oxidoreductase